jgi:4-hydroxy-3-methylbut-2-enyl diphosphate reductase
LLEKGTERGQHERRRGLRVRRLVLVAPRGYCAGVERAVDAVEDALSRWGPPIYVRKQIMHNVHVVRDLEGRGAIFVDSEEEVPHGARVVFSAHGVSPAVRERASARDLKTIDATCPLVAKVHAEARHYAAKGYSIILLGHAGHEEVEGTMGEAPDAILLVQSVEEAEYRQRAVKAVFAEIELLLVIGSCNSSNSNRLVEVARSKGVPSYLIDDESEIDESWLAGVECVGITSGASVPESLVQGVISWLRERGVEEIRSQEAVAEDVSFRLPAELR